MKLIDNIKKKLKARKKKLLEKKLKKQTKHFILDKYLSKAGFTIHSHILSRGLFKVALAINILLTLYIILFFATKQGYTLPYIILILLLIVLRLILM